MRLEYYWRSHTTSSWRPLHRPVENSPLAFCDPRTVKSQDLVAVDRPAHGQRSESYYLKFAPHQEYYWCSSQTPTEISFFTSWDSKPDDSPSCGYLCLWRYTLSNCRTRVGCPHAAFRLPATTSQLVERESIETRMIIITRVGRQTRQLSDSR